VIGLLGRIPCDLWSQAGGQDRVAGPSRHGGPFLRFHYRFVEPARSQLRTRALATAYLHDSVLPALDQHASITWEHICQQYVLREA
jgi:hypothetical protein